MDERLTMDHLRRAVAVLRDKASKPIEIDGVEYYGVDSLRGRIVGRDLIKISGREVIENDH